MYSLFDYAFAPRHIYVVSEERLREYERREKQAEIDRIDNVIVRLTQQQDKFKEELALLPAAKEEKVAA